MNHTPQIISIDRVRRLLDAYYAAETSEADERTLANFFSATPADTLPADLRADAHLFASFAETTAELPDMPADLEVSVAAAIERAAGRKRVIPLLWWTAVVSAAAAITLFLLPAADVVLSPSVSDIVNSLAGVNYQLIVPQDAPEPSVTSEPETPPQHTVYRTPRRGVVPTSSEALADNDAIIFERCTHTEVTDPDRAASILLRALRPVALLSGSDREVLDENIECIPSDGDDNNFGDDEL